jgi:hypothetical protein
LSSRCRRGLGGGVTNCGQSVKTVSHGLLSNSGFSKDDDTTSPTHIRVIRRAQVLAVDEAHNFLNRHSQRTRTLFSNMADYVLLFYGYPHQPRNTGFVGNYRTVGC